MMTNSEENLMIAYEIFRFIFALALIPLLARTIPIWLRLFISFNVMFHIIPESVWDKRWWQMEWMTIQVFNFGFIVCTTIIILYMLVKGKVKRTERLCIFGGSIANAAAILLVLCGLGNLWHPMNRFQSVISIRQYCYVALTTIMVCSWTWFVWWRPVMITRTLYLIGNGWIVWLLGSTLASTTGANGILWTFVPRHNGLVWWIGVGALSMLSELSVACYWTLNFPHYGRYNELLIRLGTLTPTMPAKTLHSDR